MQTPVPPEGNSKLWDSHAVAEFLDVPVRTLDQWAYRSEGPRFYKVGRHRRYDPVDVRRWLETRANVDQTPA